MMAATLLAATLWSILLVGGAINPPGAIGDVMHDTYFAYRALANFLAVTPVAAATLAVVIWVTRPSGQKGRLGLATAWSALLGATLTFSGAFFVTLKPVFFTDIARRSADFAAIADSVRFGYQMITAGAALALAALVGLAAIQFRQKNRLKTS